MSKKTLTQTDQPPAIAPEIVSSIILRGDLSGLSEAQLTEYMVYRSRASGLDPACQPFIVLPGQDGKKQLYATKEAAAQLNQNRELSPEVSKEEWLLDNTVYKVTYKVKEGVRTTEDCGAVALVVYQKGTQNRPGEYVKMSPAGVADAIMKAHTKAKRRAILSHCGIGTNDKEDAPLVVVDQGDGEEIKPATATIKDRPKAEKPKDKEQPEEKKGEGESKPTHDEKKADGYQPPGPDTWRGKITDVIAEQLPGGRPCWTLMGDGAVPFRTATAAHAEEVKEGVTYTIAFKKNGKGTLVVESIKEVANA